MTFYLKSTQLGPITERKVDKLGNYKPFQSNFRHNFVSAFKISLEATSSLMQES